MCLDIAEIPISGYLITSTQATVYKNGHPIIIHFWCDLSFFLVQFCYVCFLVVVFLRLLFQTENHKNIIRSISFIFYAVFISGFYQFSVNSCEEVLKINTEKRPGAFELLAGNFRYSVRVDPSFLFQNKYESLLQRLYPRQNNFCYFFFFFAFVLFCFVLLFFAVFYFSSVCALFFPSPDGRPFLRNKVLSVVRLFFQPY